MYMKTQIGRQCQIIDLKNLLSYFDVPTHVLHNKTLLQEYKLIDITHCVHT
jgi:hypothetical protein